MCLVKITAKFTNEKRTRVELTMVPWWGRTRVVTAFVGDFAHFGGQGWFLQSGRQCTEAMLDAIDEAK